MQKRNEGIDLLRCVSMLMVAALHVLNHGGVLSAAAAGSTSYHAAWLLRSVASCAVNCYALISGYVGVRARFRFRNIIPLWLQVTFYSVLIALILPVFIPGVEQMPLIAAVFPVIHRHYWYFTAYFALFFLMPLINRGITVMSRTEAKKLMVTLLAVFSGLSILPYFNLFRAIKTEDIFVLGEGASVLWLAVLYIVGGCIRVHGFGRDIRAWALWAGYGSAVLISWLYKLHVEEDVSAALRPLLHTNTLLNNTAPTTLIAGLCLLLLFSRVKQLPELPARIVGFMAPSAFSVYLIHEHRMVRAGLIQNRFAGFGADSPLWLMGKVLLAAVVIFALGVLIDQLRRFLFRWLRVRQGVDWLADLLPADENE